MNGHRLTFENIDVDVTISFGEFVANGSLNVDKAFSHDTCITAFPFNIKLNQSTHNSALYTIFPYRCLLQEDAIILSQQVDKAFSSPAATGRCNIRLIKVNFYFAETPRASANLFCSPLRICSASTKSFSQRLTLEIFGNPLGGSTLG